MTDTKSSPSRRDFLKSTGLAAAAVAVSEAAVPLVHAGESHVIQVALVGCGERGTGAAANALATKSGPIKLVAMADVFEHRLKSSYDELHKDHCCCEDLTVDEDKKFLGFDAYRKAMDCLKPGDVVILTTPPAFRWVHFAYAIEKGLNVFMEKPVTVDGPTSRRMLALAERSIRKNLKVGVGLMCRHCKARQELFDRIKGGQIGDIVAFRAYRQTGPVGSMPVPPKPNDISELLYQIKMFHGFFWASGGCFSDFLIHNIDECCWMKGAWPVQAKATGARTYRGDAIDQNFDIYWVEYTFDDGARLFLNGRTIDGCDSQFAGYAHGTRGSAIISTSSHTPARCRIYKGQKMVKKNLTWAYPPPEPSPYQLEWDHLIEAIRKDHTYNEAKRGVEASLVAAMGRMAAHTGQIVTFEEMLSCPHEFGPDVDQLTMYSPAPLQTGPNGKYPMPEPGIKRDREY